MKKIFILLISMLTTVFYAQTAEEIEVFNRLNQYVLTAKPGLEHWDYFLVTTPNSQNIRVIASPNCKHQFALVEYYNIKIPISNLYSPKLIESRGISMKPETYKIFSNLVPKPGVKRYLSEYGKLPYEETSGSFYFAFYRNGVKTYDTNVLSCVETTRKSPIDDDILLFIYLYVLASPGQL